jgi:hypothetical protein
MRSYTQTASSDASFRRVHSGRGDSASFEAGLTDLGPAFFSLFKLIEKIDGDLQRAALHELTKIYNSLFPLTINVLLGDELWRDLLAISAMRNLLAHGRTVSMEFEWGTGADKALLDSSSMKSVAARLQKEGILPKEAIISCDSYHQWETKIFCDQALLYFYDALSKIEVKLRSSVASNRESELIARMPCLLPLHED